MGGDEFVMVLPGLDATKVDEKVGQLRLRVNKIHAEPSLSLSVGQALYPQDGDNVELLLAAPDVKMYKNKQAREYPTPQSASPSNSSLDQALVS